MRVVGLVSGGKDSLYNLQQCVAHGHTVVCLANLYPEQQPGTGKAPPAGATGAAAAEAGDGSEHDSAAAAGGDAGVVHELDSYMFQTVGHTGVDAIAAAMGVPIVRRAFRGKAVQTGVQYLTDEASTEDEIESMLALLREVQVRVVPLVRAVVCGCGCARAMADGLPYATALGLSSCV